MSNQFSTAIPTRTMNASEKSELADKIAARFGCEFQPTGERGVVALMILPHAQGQMVSPIEACKTELARCGVLPDRMVESGA